MTIRFTPADVLSNYQAIEDINNNFALIAELLDNAVMRDGSTPNAILANLDVNHFRLLNVGNAVDPTDAPNLSQVQTLIGTITKGDKGDPGPAGLYFATRTLLKALTTHNDYDKVGLTEYGYEGDFVFLTAATFAAKTGLTLTTVVTDDVNGGFVVPPAADTSGASGAWVRQGLLLAKHFGCVSSGAADDTTAFQRAANLIIKYPSLRHDLSGTFGLSSVVTVGPATQASPPPVQAIVGDCKFVALNAFTTEMIRLKNLTYRKWQGSLDATGTGSSSFASRTCPIPFYFENCSRLKISGGIVVVNFSLGGAWLGTANNNLMNLGFVRGTNIGSGQAQGLGLTGNWSNPVNAGSANSSGQTTTINTSVIYSSALDTFLDVAGQNDPVHLRIGGYLYSVKSIDRVGGTTTVFPWVDTGTLGVSGTYEWVFGGAAYTRNTDASLIIVTGLDVNNCGRGIVAAAAYGPGVDMIQANGCGTVALIGRNNSSTCLGTLIKGFYAEGSTANQEHLVVNSAIGSSLSAQMFGDSGGFDIAKCWNISAPRNGGGQLVGSEFGNTTTNAGSVAVSLRGRILQYLKGSLNNLPGSSINLRGQTSEPKILTYRKDTATFLLNVEGAGEYNRLFGYSGSLFLVVGTGTNGSPTGTITITPPSGGTVNGGSVDASATFTGFSGPVLFTYEHTDTAQLTWIVRPMTGFRLKASTTYDPPSLAAKGSAGDNTTTTVACTGAALGDAFVPSFSLSLAGLQATAYVNATNSVTVVFQNLTAGVVDLASGTLTVTKVS